MNTVESKRKAEKIRNPQKGDIYKDPEGLFYILACVDNGWVAICLHNGAYWRATYTNPSQATLGLELVTNEANIIIQYD